MNNFTKGIVTLALAGSFIVGAGSASYAQAQGRQREERWGARDSRWDEWRDRKADRVERRQEREELQRIRQLDRQRQLRYQNFNGRRIVGYYDRDGHFHPFGYYDRRNQFWRYQ